MTGDSIADTAPPMAHAVGGSLGSALALLLLYPLERARVELQTMSASASANRRDNSTVTNTNTNTDINDKVMPIPKGGATSGSTSTGGGTPLTATGISSQSGDEIQNNEFCRTTSPSEGSWESCLSSEEGINSSSEENEGENTQVTSTKSSASSKKRKQSTEKLGVLACIYQLHQRKELYRGVTPVVTTMALSNYVFFYFHSFLRGYLRKHATASKQTSTLRLSLLASSLAGIANVLLTNPLWVANLRIVTSGNDKEENTNNLWTEMKYIIKTEGWAHLWNGTPASLLLVSNPVIQFVAYEQLKNRLLGTRNAGGGLDSLKQKVTALKPLEAFLLGALAKAISTILTYPLQLAQTVLRVQKQNDNPRQNDQAQQETTKTTKPDTNDVYNGSSTTSTEHTTSVSPSIPTHRPNMAPPTYRGTLDCLFQIYQRKGLEGWFAGMRTKLLQTVLTAAFTFLTYEQIIKAIMAVLRALQESRRIRNAAHAANLAT